MNDKIFIKNLEVMTTIGVYDYEQLIKQKLIINIEIDYDLFPCSVNDDLDLTINYAQVADLILDYCKKTKGIKLIETLAQNLINEIKLQFHAIKFISLSIDKYLASQNNYIVGIKINRNF